ncbi:hypothetical protein [Allomuricauda sp. F6463D]|uniref:hypothetical protein n=1 Tax=Allomuricauda sp. F6463D TaxID=2926409 RepID=UPI001FF15A18|nr:hypothetical protein [Muricauda sp. F6463D]MCK0161071.1 hypothetical protein [Muricauda sp. F6463D]
MKSFKLVCMAMVSMAVILVSCSGEDGEKGQQGIAGDAGTDGISCWDLNGNGTGDANEDINEDGNYDAMDCQGEQGVTGNANVQRWSVLLNGFSNSELDFPFPIQAEEVNDYAYFFYLESENGNIFPLPGSLISNLVHTTLYINVSVPQVEVSFWNSDNNSAYVVPDGLYVNFYVIAVELSQANKNSKESLMSELKTAGVDTSDYNAVADYFGLE